MNLLVTHPECQLRGHRPEPAPRYTIATNGLAMTEKEELWESHERCARCCARLNFRPVEVSKPINRGKQ